VVLARGQPTPARTAEAQRSGVAGWLLQRKARSSGSRNGRPAAKRADIAGTRHRLRVGPAFLSPAGLTRGSGLVPLPRTRPEGSRLLSPAGLTAGPNSLWHPGPDPRVRTSFGGPDRAPALSSPRGLDRRPQLFLGTRGLTRGSERLLAGLTGRPHFLRRAGLTVGPNSLWHPGPDPRVRTSFGGPDRAPALSSPRGLDPRIPASLSAAGLGPGSLISRCHPRA
jgi:hypothetical protein